MFIKCMLLGSGGILGFLYFKKHPEKIEMLKNMMKDSSREMTKMME